MSFSRTQAALAATLLLSLLTSALAVRRRSHGLSPASAQRGDSPLGSRKLDVVIAHYHAHTLAHMLRDWSAFLQTEKIRSLEPAVFVYSMNARIKLSDYTPLVRGNGSRAVRLPNVGREGAAYLTHILGHWDRLADHTLFSQATFDPIMSARVEHLFGPETGVLALALFAHEDCRIDDPNDWLPRGQLTQLYAIFVRRICPPEGYSAMFNGGILVSRARIRSQPRDVWQHGLLMADMTHFIHTQHDNPRYKRLDDPFFGHPLERAWSLAFGCHELHRYMDCERCEQLEWRDCAPDACQCLDQEPED